MLQTFETATEPGLAPASFDLIGAIMDYESGALDEDEIIDLFQRLVDSGLAYQLQGCYGRMAESLITQGLVHRD